MKKITTILSAFAAVLATTAASAQCPGGQAAVTVDVTTDSWGYEAYWELTPQGAGCGTSTIAQYGNVAEVGCAGGGLQVATGGGYANNTTTTENLGCLTNGDCFDINYVDDWGDGGADFDVYFDGILDQSFTGSGTGGVFTFCVSAPLNYDAAITNGAMYEYVQVPSFEVNTAANCINDLEVTSAGAMDLTGVTVTATVLQDLSPIHTETITIGAIASGAAGTATFTAFMPTAVGNYAVVYQVNSTETDEDASNNTWGYEFAIGTAVYARDNDDEVGNIYIGADGDGYIGVSYDVIDPYSILTGVSVKMNNETNANDGLVFDVEVFATDGSGVPTTSLATVTGTVGTTATSDWYDLTLGTPLNLAAGKYVIAIKEAANTTNGYLGYASGAFTPGTIYAMWGGTSPAPWTLVETLGAPVAFMIRGTFATSAAVAEMESMEVALYPNPATDEVTISNIANGNSIEVINAEGRVVYTGTVNNSVETINVSNLDAGFYTVKVTGNNVIGINRFVKK